MWVWVEGLCEVWVWIKEGVMWVRVEELCGWLGGLFQVGEGDRVPVCG